MLENIAWAAKGPGQPGIGEMLLPLGLMFLVFYFLLIGPQVKKNKLQQNMLRNLKKTQR